MLLTIIDNYDSFTYNLYQQIWRIGSAFGVKVSVYRNNAISADEIQKLSPSAIVISPGPGNPNNSGISIELVKRFSKKIPILGVCLGHQVIATAFGGRVTQAPVPMHGKASKIYHNNSNLFTGIKSELIVARYHSLIVEPESLPKELKISSKTEDNIIMSMYHTELPIFGVQFHPESFLTEYGDNIIRNFLTVVKNFDN